MDNRPGGGEEYAVPSNQQIFVRGNTCIEQVSVPGLQSYYSNLQMVGREYGYFQLSHFDFPLNDSLTKTFGGDYIDVGFRATCYFGRSEQDLTNPSQWFSTQYDTIFTIPVRRVHSIGDLADHLNNAMSMLDLHGENNAHRWKFFLHSITWDASLQKLVFTLKIPDHSYTWSDNGGRMFPMRMTFYLWGAYPEKPAKLAAAIFGGKTRTEEDSPIELATWTSEWDTGPTFWLHMASIFPDFNTQDKDLHVMAANFSIASQRPPRMFVEPYVYIRGAPAQSIWDGRGNANNLISVQPRNRPAGVITNEQAYLSNQTHITKTALSSLRSMMIAFTDADGDPLVIDEEYVVKLGIQFQP